MSDMVNHPAHYTQHESGVECIEVTQGMQAPNLSNAFKYLFRAGLKGDPLITHKQDLQKAAFYVRQQIAYLRDGDCASMAGVFLSCEDDPVFHALIKADESESIGDLSIVLELIDDKLEALR